jgi:hypothetical protein
MMVMPVESASVGYFLGSLALVPWPGDRDGVLAVGLVGKELAMIKLRV